MTEPVFKSGRQRQAEYVNRLDKLGLLRITVTVPRLQAEAVKDHARRLTLEYLDQYEEMKKK